MTIESDAIKKRLLPHIKLRSGGASSDSVGMDGTTSSKVLSIDEKAIRSCGCNALAMGVAVLTDDRNRRVLTGVCLISEGLLSWHSEESTTCRSVTGNQKWLLGQVSGGAMKAVMNMYNVLENETFMEKTGFLYSNLVDHNVITDHEVQQEDELADLLGDFNLSLAQSRTRRQAYMYGWLHLMVETLGTLDEARAVLQLFNGDSKNFHALQAELNPTELQSEYTHRSQFQTLAVKQLECGAKHHN